MLKWLRPLDPRRAIGELFDTFSFPTGVDLGFGILRRLWTGFAGCCLMLALLAEPLRAEDASVITPGYAVQLTHAWDKVFPKSSMVDHEKVTFTNRYGITLAADLYLPMDRGNKQLAALVVDGPFGSVKEQVSGRYAQIMAERGFATIAFDRSYTGESGGEPRNLASPEINAEDVSAAVDYIGLLPNVDQSRIGVIGICGGGGFALNAAAVDKRIKAVVALSMYDISRLMAQGYYDKMDLAGRKGMLEHISQQRWVDAKNGAPAPGPSFLPQTLDGVTDPVVRMYFDFYKTPRGFHKRSLNSEGAFTGTVPLSFVGMPILTRIAEISPRPLLLIAGEKAHSRYFSEDAYKAAAEPKELLIVRDAIHTDLYDQDDKIPFDKIDAFFEQHLRR